MLRHWYKILTRDCTVIKANGYTVYPIHRVGFTSLMHAADATYTNSEISGLQHIDVLIRDPEERFISGVNEYARQNNYNVLDVYEKVKNQDFVDTHFIPQYFWLMNLYRFFRGEITIRPFSFIANITDVHMRKDESRVDLHPLENFTEVDAEIIRKTTVQKRYHIKDFIKAYRHVLS